MQDVVGCVTHDRLNAKVFQAKIGPCDSLVFQKETAELSGTQPLKITLLFTYQLVSGIASSLPLTMSVVRYHYHVRDASNAEIVKYHFHPPGSEREDGNPWKPSVPYLHLHVTSNVSIGSVTFDRHHLPTGALPPTEFIRLLIEQWGVIPLTENWRSRLSSARRLYFQEPFWTVPLGHL